MATESAHRTKLSTGTVRNIFLIMVVLIGLTLWLRGVFVAPNKDASERLHQNSGVPPLVVSVLTVSTSSGHQLLDVTGSINAELDSSVSSRVTAQVKKVLVHEGDTVKRGDLLAVLDSQDLDAAVRLSNTNLTAANIKLDSALINSRMEQTLNNARITEANANVAQADAALQVSKSKLALLRAGPRRQERRQADLTVSQAQISLTLSENDLKRFTSLYQEGAVSAQQLDMYKTRFDVARTELETAKQSKSISDEGSRAEELQIAQEAVRQSEAAVQAARASLQSAKALSQQIDVKRQEIKGAHAQIGQAVASAEMSHVTQGYTAISAPFAGVITKRLTDPGTMAGLGVPLFRLHGGSFRLEAVLPESALPYVKQGALVPVHIASFGVRSISGRVVEISRQGDTNTHSFIVKIEIPSDIKGVIAGMFGRATFSLNSDTRMLVPSSALTEKDGLHYLFVVDSDHHAKLRMITTGEPVGNSIPVLSGLNSGERIVSKRDDQLQDGSLVVEESSENNVIRK